MSTDALPTHVAMGVSVYTKRDSRWDNSVVLSDVAWGEYVTLRDKPANRGLRMTQTHSDALPGFPFEQLINALAQRQAVDETALLIDFRKWIAQRDIKS